MADEQLIKPRELPAATTVFADDAIMTDNGSVVGKATPVQIVNAGAPVPTEAEAIAGTDNSKRMTPLTVKQVLDSVTAPSVLRAQAWAESDSPPDPGIPGSMSAKSWASEAERLGAEQADRAEAAADRAGIYGPRTTDTIASFLTLPETDEAQYATQTGQVYKGLPDGTPMAAPHIQAVDGRIVEVLPDGMRAYNIKAFGRSSVKESLEYAILAAKEDSSNASSWLSDIPAVFVPPSDYVLDDTVVVSQVPNLVMETRGALFIQRDEGFSPFKFVASPNMQIKGLTFDMLNNSGPDEAILLAGQCAFSTFVDLRVLANSENPEFAFVRMKQGTPSGFNDDNRDVGNFWITFDRPWTRKRTGADTGGFAYAFDLQGSQNAIRINNGRLGHFTKAGVLIRNQNGSALSGITNDVQLLQTAFETYTGPAIKYVSEGKDGGAAPTIPIAGGAAIGCRFEDGDAVFESLLSAPGTVNNISQPFQFYGSTVISSVPKFATDNSALHYTNLGGSVTPSTPAVFLNHSGLRVLGVSGSGNPALSVQALQRSPGGSDGSVSIVRIDGTRDGGISQMPGGGIDIDGGSPGRVRVTGMNSISGTGTAGRNLRGRFTAATEDVGLTNKAITFPNAEPDASYYVMLTGNKDRKLWWSSRTASGFTINTDTAWVAGDVVEWLLVR